MHDAVAGSHDLDFVAPEDVRAGKAVAVGQAAVDHIGQDLHVAMAVRSEPLAGRDAILVEHAQHAEAHEVRILIAAEGECGVGVQPPEVGAAAVFAPANRDHEVISVVRLEKSKMLARHIHTARPRQRRHLISKG